MRRIRLGAAGYLNKIADPDDMVAAVREVAGGGLYVTPATAEALAASVGATHRARAPRRSRIASTRCSARSRKG